MEPRRPSLCHANIRKGDGAASAATTSRSSVTPRLERQDIRGYRRPGSHGGSSAPLPSLHSRTRHSMNILFALRPPSPPPIAPSPHRPIAPVNPSAARPSASGRSGGIYASPTCAWERSRGRCDKLAVRLRDFQPEPRPNPRQPLAGPWTRACIHMEIRWSLGRALLRPLDFLNLK
jgi:hypothetical protein